MPCSPCPSPCRRRAETTDQLLGETFYDCYASIDANYFTNRDMKRGAMLYQAIEAMWARGADRLRKDPGDGRAGRMRSAPA